MDDLRRASHRITGPFLHGSAVDILLRMLERKIRSDKTTNEDVGGDGYERLTSKVIQEIGSSSGMGVRLIIFKVRASSSNSKVKMAPGGVHVPTIK
jgi:hypothetical protein